MPMYNRSRKKDSPAMSTLASVGASDKTKLILGPVIRVGFDEQLMRMLPAMLSMEGIVAAHETLTSLALRGSPSRDQPSHSASWVIGSCSLEAAGADGRPEALRAPPF